MDKQDLVKRMAACWNATRGKDCHDAVASVPTELLARAIAYINTTPSRDEVPEEAAAIADEYSETPHGAAIARRIRALKSTPTFTRADGTISPLRGTVEDRRKSAHGIGNQDDVRHMWRRGAEGEHVVYGRRSNDRARWTGEAAPVVDWREKDLDVIATQPAAPVVQSGKREMTSDEYRDFWNGKNPTQPAQEAPQPEKPGLVKDFERIFCGQWQTLDRFPVDAPVQFGAVKWIVRRLAELDARQGEK